MSIDIRIGDALEQLKQLPDGVAHTCVTSPPYWGLRDYGVAGQIGLERTPEEYVEKIVAVFREVRRVFRPDATLWLNLGDSYAASGRGGNPVDSPHQKQRTNRGSVLPAGLHESARKAGVVGRAWCGPPPGLKQKDLVGIPWMVAFALRADGWYLRSDIIWHKPNPMPESVTDRPTKAHEYLFLLAKQERYYYDADAIAQPLKPSSYSRLAQDVESQQGSARVPGKTNGTMRAVSRNPSKGANTGDRLDGGIAKTGNAQTSAGLHRNGGNAQRLDATTRNARTVWTVTTQPFSDAHFATFPPKLIEPCILAGCPAGGTVLDPFGGAGTTGLVADRLSRNAILIELNPAYAAMARERIRSDAPLFAEEA